MSSILEQLQLDKTFIYEFILFAVFFFVLSGIYLKPFQRLLEKRNHKLKNELEGASELLKSVEAKVAEYQTELAQIRNQAQASYDKAISDAKAREDAAMVGLRTDLKKEHQKALADLEKSKTQIEAELAAQVDAMADGVASRVLGGK